MRRASSSVNLERVRLLRGGAATGRRLSDAEATEKRLTLQSLPPLENQTVGNPREVPIFSIRNPPASSPTLRKIPRASASLRTVAVDHVESASSVTMVTLTPSHQIFTPGPGSGPGSGGPSHDSRPNARQMPRPSDCAGGRSDSASSFGTKVSKAAQPDTRWLMPRA